MSVTWHCFFEQSGTFRNEFRKLGFISFDYDIENQFSTTDFCLDLFKEIENAYAGLPSIFDNLNSSSDRIMAFFPCIKFSVQFSMLLSCRARQYCYLPDIDKAKKSLSMIAELVDYFTLLNKLVIVCCRLNLPLVIENPYRKNEHFLSLYWFKKPDIIDLNRRENGDYFCKPTQYFFFNCKPSNNLLFDEPIAFFPIRNVTKSHGINRSLLSPDYARRFIRSYLIGV